MIRRFLISAVLLFAVPLLVRADSADLIKSSILESNVAYFLVGSVGKNLPDEIQSAGKTLTATNPVAGVVLDLRFADGSDSDSARATADWLAQEKMPVAILIDSQTRDAAAKLAANLRDAHAGLIFGNATAGVEPDISVSISTNAEKRFLKNPFGTFPTNGVSFDDKATNDFLPFVDHTSEADLVRERVKDGDQEVMPESSSGPPKPFIRDPVLARGCDFIKGQAALHPESR